MNKNLEVLGVIFITWECQTCGVEFDTEAPIFTNINGEYVCFSCENCGHDYEVELEGDFN